MSPIQLQMAIASLVPKNKVMFWGTSETLVIECSDCQVFFQVGDILIKLELVGFGFPYIETDGGTWEVILL